ncbi:MAG TPA: mannose-1-phosphate guanylyltransferase/mannose-6-phosphate isomerase [Spirochaetaceae bacterium]|nr:mannose-1-phosphate guanylyltransferase/mannose-6-phosphate isomerase [Spirochaetaceae bacterium]
MTNIILCGGAGTRLWPLSRTLMPKQFAKLLGDTSLFYRSVERNLSLCDDYIIVTNADQWFLAAADLAAMPLAERPRKLSFVLEPVGRNTAPAIALACLELDPQELVLVSASDHHIKDPASYRERVGAAAALAREGYLVSFGIEPGYPETGYGYLQADAARPLPGRACYAVKAFKEKPDAASAERYLASGDYLWNSGMFVFSAGAYLAELKAAAPDMYTTCLSAHARAKRSADPKSGYPLVSPLLEDMKAIPANSVDYAVMEKSSKVAAVRSDFDWRDVGSYDALYELADKDANGNAVKGNAAAAGALSGAGAASGFSAIDSHGNLVLSERAVAAVSVDNLIIIDSGDALLVAKRGSSQGVKAIVDGLRAGGEAERALTHAHLTVHRPWGSYTILDEGPGFKVKRISVSPGSRLSLQKHARRAERWVVTGGVPIITIDAERRAYALGEIAQIPLGAVHRLENEGSVDALIIETQIGDYLGEDDIVRLEDVYGRA